MSVQQNNLEEAVTWQVHPAHVVRDCCQVDDLQNDLPWRDRLFRGHQPDNALTFVRPLPNFGALVY